MKVFSTHECERAAEGTEKEEEEEHHGEKKCTFKYS
jgi:hypothetical protein